jgi:hypothetical protein
MGACSNTSHMWVQNHLISEAQHVEYLIEIGGE